MLADQPVSWPGNLRARGLPRATGRAPFSAAGQGAKLAWLDAEEKLDMDRNCRFDEKSIIVTGAGMGIGQGAAIAFAREGGCVIAADISAAAADQTVREITSAGGRAISVQCDVSR